MNSKQLLEQLLLKTVWLPIKGYDNYEVSICGMVRNVITKRILKPFIGTTGYYYVTFYKNSIAKKHKIHRLVANQFLPNINNEKCIDHLNNCKLDNTISNLRWVTHQKNMFNQKLSKINTSGAKGVYFYKPYQKWKAQIQINNKSIFLGYFDNIGDAKIARQKKSNELFVVSSQ